MSEEKIFAEGLIVKRNEEAPDFVICNLSVKVGEFTAFLLEHQSNGWANLQVKKSKGGKYYAELDTWKPTQGDSAKAGMVQAKQAAEPDPFEDSDSIPFSNHEYRTLV